MLEILLEFWVAGYTNGSGKELSLIWLEVVTLDDDEAGGKFYMELNN
jgi:hypothetical protein